MQLHYSRLNQRDRRLYAALEAQKLPLGGKIYISKLLPINRHTLNKGMAELLHEELYNQVRPGKQRRVGGGRKKILCPS